MPPQTPPKDPDRSTRTERSVTRHPRGPMRKRAISDDHKQQRRQAILDAALALLAVTPYEQITMQHLADHLGLVKGTLYLYFATKEALFLALQEQQLQDWFADLHAALETYRTAERPADRTLWPGALAHLIVESIGRHRQFPQLLALLHSVLERNISLHEARAFKGTLRILVGRAGPALEAALPTLGAGQGIELLLRLHALVIGTWLVTDPSAVVSQAIADPAADLGVFDLKFAPFLTGALTALLTGMATAPAEVQHVTAATAEVAAR